MARQDGEVFAWWIGESGRIGEDEFAGAGRRRFERPCHSIGTSRKI